jgi:hypothetical protein
VAVVQRVIEQQRRDLVQQVAGRGALLRQFVSAQQRPDGAEVGRPGQFTFGQRVVEIGDPVDEFVAERTKLIPGQVERGVRLTIRSTSFAPMLKTGV